MVQKIVKLGIFLFKTTILNLNLLYKDIFVRIVRKLFLLLLILLAIILTYLIILSMLLRLGFKKIFLLHLIAKRYNISISSVQRIMDECYSDFKVNKDHKNIILTFVKNHIIAKVLSTNLAAKRKQIIFQKKVQNQILTLIYTKIFFNQ